MQLPWRPPHKPARLQAGAWPPTATQCLLGVLALSLLAQYLLRYFADVDVQFRAFGQLSMAGLAAGHYWQPVTYLFLLSKASPWMDFAALLVLYVAGHNLEQIIGRRHLYQLYFLAGVLGGLAQLGYSEATQQAVPLVGPAAAVMGVLVALTSVMPNLELAPLLGFPLPFWLKIKHCAVGAALACAILPLALPHHILAQQEAIRCLAGCLTGCIYMRQLGFGRRSRTLAEPVEREPMLSIAVFSQAKSIVAAAEHTSSPTLPRFTERERRMTPRQYISEQIDPILDKISLHGMACLTMEERRILEKGRDKISQRDG